MAELRVALFTGNYNHIRDGVSLTLNRWVSYLQEHSVPVVVFGPSVDEPAIDHVGEFIPVPSITAPGRPDYRISTGLSRKAKHRLDEFNPTLIHIATPDLLGYQALSYARHCNKTVVSSYHTHFTSYLKYYKLQLLEPLVWKYLTWFYNYCQHIYAPSPSIKKLLEDKGVSGLRLWARGVDTELFNPNKRNNGWRRRHNIPVHNYIICIVSRLVWEKGLKTFARAVEIICSRSNNISALVVGDGPVRSEMETMMPKAHFTGFLKGDELAKAYANSDIFMFPSDTETFGNVTLESLASGVPAVVANAGGSNSLVNNGFNGYLAEPGDAEQFAERAEKIMADISHSDSMRKAARREALNYSWENINGQLLDYYYQAINATQNIYTANRP